MTSDRDPLDLCQRLLHNASSLVTLLIRRPVIVSKQQSGQSSSAHPHTLPSRIKQVPASGDVQLKSATFDRFQLVRLKTVGVSDLLTCLICLGTLVIKSRHFVVGYTNQ